jgi:hypothetical protein
MFWNSWYIEMWHAWGPCHQSSSDRAIFGREITSVTFHAMIWSEIRASAGKGVVLLIALFQPKGSGTKTFIQWNRKRLSIIFCVSPLRLCIMKNWNFEGIRLSECWMRKLYLMIRTLDGGHLQPPVSLSWLPITTNILRADTRVGHRKTAMRVARQLLKGKFLSVASSGHQSSWASDNPERARKSALWPFKRFSWTACSRR